MASMAANSIQAKVLFICTGNYYRSRYAEALFNHQAEQMGLRWRAFSRGLAIHMADGLDGELALNTRRALESRSIPLHYCGACRVQLTAVDLANAGKIVAMDRWEHQPMVLNQFPLWDERVEYWDSQDLQWEAADSSMRKIERNVKALVLGLGDCVDALPGASSHNWA